MNRVFSFIIFLVIFSKVDAQTNSYIPNVIPPSPNASSIAKFGNMPVSTYTGATDITVPIYNIEAKGLSVPISLSYHTGGIRLKEEAGLVGLGWALQAGGMISRTIMDKDDFKGDYFTSNLPQPTGTLLSHPYCNGCTNMGDKGYNFFCDYNVVTTDGVYDYTNAYQTGNIFNDMEPDIYNYSFLGKSGKFMISRDKKIIIKKQENLKITFDPGGNWFKIIDDQGNVFLFNSLELSEPAAGGTQSVSSWELTQVTTQLNDVISFTYSSDDTWTNVPGDLHQVNRTGCTTPALTQVTPGGTQYLNNTLQTIDFNSGQLQFYYDSWRSDLEKGKKLNSIKIFSKTPSGLNFIKQSQLFYSYLDSNPADSFGFNRLCLDSVKEISGSTKTPPYIFTYNQDQAGSNSGKQSFGVDNWGYYNGKGNGSFIPNFSGMVNISGVATLFTYAGADRSADINYMQLFSLQQVQYPTGGKTVLEYEANDYDDAKSKNGPQEFPQLELVTHGDSYITHNPGTTTGTEDFSKIYPIIPQGTIGFNANLAITFRSAKNDACAPFRMNNGKIYFDFNGNRYDISSNSLTCSGNICTMKIDLTINAATYPWAAYIDPHILSGFEDISAYFTFKETKIASNNGNPTLIAGGLRIKSITDYIDATTVAKKRRYEYNYTGFVNNSYMQLSYGKLMSYPSYCRYEFDFSGPYICNWFTQFSSSNTQLTSTVNGNIVGYDRVNEYTIDPQTGADIGKTEYNYFNSPDTVYFFNGYRLPGLLNMANNLNGTLISKVDYVNNGGNYLKVDEQDNYYHTENRIAYFAPKSTVLREVTVHPPGDNGCSASNEPYNVEACFYPVLKSEKILLDSTWQIQYDNTDPNKAIVSKSFFNYDNPLHYQPTRTTSFDSKGNQHTSLLRYPQDYLSGSTTGSSILDAMISKNFLSPTIEKRDSLYYAGSSLGFVRGAISTFFKLLSTNVIALDKQFKLEIAGSINNFQPLSVSAGNFVQDIRYRQMISMDQYDNYNNIIQYTPEDGIPVSMLWDYYGHFPIAQAKYAQFNQIRYTSFEADGSGGWTIPSSTRNTTDYFSGSKSYNLSNGNITTSLVSSSIPFIVSFWTKNGAATINSVSAATPLVRNGWTYNEYTLPVGIAYITISSASAAIDELRLYPKQGMMSTYTYSPLVGMTTGIDQKNRANFYTYDGLGRLTCIKDQDGNIIKTIQYHYQRF